MTTEIQKFPTTHIPHYSFLDQLPTFSHQMAFATSGIITGFASLPIEAINKRLETPKFQLSSFLKQHTLPHLSRMAIRFWTFDIALSETQKWPIPIYCKTSIAGASGGLVELATYSLIYERQRPSVQLLKNLSVYSTGMLLGFATFTYLATRNDQQFPPKPYWYCWCLGASAGGVASSVTGLMKGARGVGLASHVLKSMFLIGTVISVQVTSSAQLVALL